MSLHRGFSCVGYLGTWNPSIIATLANFGESSLASRVRAQLALCAAGGALGLGNSFRIHRHMLLWWGLEDDSQG
jgi:hypothetical protein